jgi:crossover junction endodeoxyribonuclease RuvC
MRVLGVDPGLTRCGLGIVENGTAQKLVMVGVGVIQTSNDIELSHRLLELETQLMVWIKEYKPDVIAVERVFSQLNIRTAMSTGQAAGVALLIAARSGIPVAMHTPTEVKAAVTGSGRADKKQVALMVQKLLSLKEIPKPVDSTDALALAICHHWRGSGNARIETAVAKERARLAKVAKK